MEQKRFRKVPSIKCRWNSIRNCIIWRGYRSSRWRKKTAESTRRSRKTNTDKASLISIWTLREEINSSIDTFWKMSSLPFHIQFTLQKLNVGFHQLIWNFEQTWSLYLVTFLTNSNCTIIWMLENWRIFKFYFSTWKFSLASAELILH